MKVLAISGVVVLLSVVCLVQTQPAQPPKTPGFWEEFFRNVTADVCQDKEELCKANMKRCSSAVKTPKVDTEEAVSIVRTNMTECAEQIKATNADFTTLTVEVFKEEAKYGGTTKFLMHFGLEENQVAPILECFMEKKGDLAMMKTCVVTSASESS